MPSISSHGRGGAGNLIARESLPIIEPSDLRTPFLKGAVITTGRGGSGNMARNSDPYETRMMQDVES